MARPSNRRNAVQVTETIPAPASTILSIDTDPAPVVADVVTSTVPTLSPDAPTTEPITVGLTANTDERLADLDDEPTDPSTDGLAPTADELAEIARAAIEHAIETGIDQKSPVLADVQNAAHALRSVQPEAARTALLAGLVAAALADARMLALAPGADPETAFNAAIDQALTVNNVGNAIGNALTAPPARPAPPARVVDRVPGASALLFHCHALSAAIDQVRAEADAWIGLAANPNATRVQAGTAAADRFAELTDEQRAATLAPLTRAVRNATRTRTRSTSGQGNTTRTSTGTGERTQHARTWSHLDGEVVTYTVAGTVHTARLSLATDAQGRECCTLTTEDGTVHASSSAAARAFNGGTQVNGMVAWKLPNGDTLDVATRTAPTA